MNNIDPLKLKHRELLLLIYDRVDKIAQANEARDQKTEDLFKKVRGLELWRNGITVSGTALVGAAYIAWEGIKEYMRGGGSR